MNYRILSLSLIVTVAGAFTASARTLSPEQALSRLDSANGLHKKVSGKKYKLVYTSTDSVSSEPGAYVFTAGNEGFMVLSADDQAPALLGYSDESALDAGALPPSFIYWLNQYSSQIEAARRNGAKVYAPARPNREPIQPMVTTQWNQNAPYDLMTPQVNGKQSVTGCVATAMAQVMNYHQWPPVGQGSNSYSWNGTTISLNFAGVTFDWNNMLDSYDSSSTQTQQDAVAQLMYACGVAVDMDYSPTESGAQSAAVAAALYNYFNYDKSVVVMYRDYYNLYDWEDIVYDQLQNYGPVQYSGVSSDGGHSFVCDGYSTDGYFHINWGWGGMSDGYFLLTALDPETQGIGGSTSGYNSMQDIVANVSKPKQNSQFVNMMLMQEYTLGSSMVSLGRTVAVTGFTYNGSIMPLSGTLGMKVVSDAGQTSYISAASFSGLEYLYGMSSWSFQVPSDIAAGTYRISPVFTTDGINWTDIQVPISGPAYYIMTVSGNTATFTQPTPVTIAVSDVEVQSDIYVGVNCRITGTMTNTNDNDFYNPIAPALYTGSTLYAIGEQTTVNVPGGASRSLDYMGQFSTTKAGATIAAGDYTLRFIDVKTSQPISDGVTVKVNTKPASVSLSFSGLKLNSDNVVSDPTAVEFSGTLRVVRGAFGGTFEVAIFPKEEGELTSVDIVTSDPIFAAAGQSVNYSFKRALTNVEVGKSYYAAIYVGQKQYGSAIVFTVTSPAGLETVEDTTGFMAPTVTDGTVSFIGETPSQMNVYSSSGAVVMEVRNSSTVDLTNCPGGIYFIEVINNNNNSKIINRVIRR